MRSHRISIATILAGAWLTLVALVGVFAPVVASGFPVVVRDTAASTTTSPLVAHLRPIDFALVAALLVAALSLIVNARSSLRRVVRASAIVALTLGIGAAFESATPVRLRVFSTDFHTPSDTRHITHAPVPYSPDERIPGARLAPPGAETPDGRTLLLGADARGQDVLAQLIHGARTAMLVSIGSALIAMALGIAVGACMGWFSGWIDTALMRIVEAAMSIPVLLILVVAAGVLPRQLGITMLVIGLITWTDAARLTRAEFLRLRDQDFALAARASGASAWRIITLHLLPSALPPVLVEASFALAAAILFEASLSFLGLGPSEGASWGRLLAQGLDPTGRPLWWITVPAGLLIFLTVVSLHAVGDTLRHRIAPVR